MKHIIITASLMLISAVFCTSAEAAGQQQTTVAEASSTASDYVDFFLNGYTFKIPQGLPVNMEGSQATVKAPDGTFGLSVEFEKDAKASAQGAYNICKRVVTDLHIQGAKLTKVNINGLEGAAVEGELEGVNVAVEVLDTGKRYLKIIAIYTDSRAADAKMALTSITKE